MFFLHLCFSRYPRRGRSLPPSTSTRPASRQTVCRWARLQRSTFCRQTTQAPPCPLSSLAALRRLWWCRLERLDRRAGRLSGVLLRRPVPVLHARQPERDQPRRRTGARQLCQPVASAEALLRANRHAIHLDVVRRRRGQGGHQELPEHGRPRLRLPMIPQSAVCYRAPRPSAAT